MKNAFYNLLKDIPVPKMYPVKQLFDNDMIANTQEELIHRLHDCHALEAIHPGSTVAITVGSRGIDNMPLLVKTVVSEVKHRGGNPFLVPAMGSHGGATSEGQRNMAIDLGYSEEYIGAPILSDIQPVRIGTARNGLPVYFDKNAIKADWTIIMNRIKPHTSFRNRIESGLEKMTVIGLGKQHGAELAHSQGVDKLGKTIECMAEVTLSQANILCGIGVLENAFHKTCKIAVLRPEEIPEQEVVLLEEAKSLCAKLYFPEFDVLIVEEIGKEIAGTGMDPNVIGRFTTPYCSGGPNITSIAALNLTDLSHGNGYGIGLADYTTRKVFDKFDFSMTYPNSLTNGVTLPVKIPMVLDNDLQAIKACIKCCHTSNMHNVRMIKIKNTLQLETIEVSEGLLEEVYDNPKLKICGDAYELQFDDDGNLK